MSTLPLLTGIFAVITLLLVVFVLVRVFKTKQKFSSADLAFFRTQWKKVYEKVQNQPNMAILDADKLLYKALDKKGYQGSLGEKLMAKPFSGETLNNTWQAHKVRNRIAHETDVQLSSGEVKRMMRYYEDALRTLGSLR